MKQKPCFLGMVGPEKEPGFLVRLAAAPPAWPAYTGLLFKERGINFHPILVSEPNLSTPGPMHEDPGTISGEASQVWGKAWGIRSSVITALIQ